MKMRSKVFQAEQRAGANGLRWQRAWTVVATGRRTAWLEWREEGEEWSEVRSKRCQEPAMWV